MNTDNMNGTLPVSKAAEAETFLVKGAKPLLKSPDKLPQQRETFSSPPKPKQKASNMKTPKSTALAISVFVGGGTSTENLGGGVVQTPRDGRRALSFSTISTRSPMARALIPILRTSAYISFMSGVVTFSTSSSSRFV